MSCLMLRGNTHTLSLTTPNFSGNCALTILSENVVTNFDIFSGGEMTIKLKIEFKTISKSKTKFKLYDLFIEKSLIQ